jgi:hypothetical protein
MAYVHHEWYDPPIVAGFATYFSRIESICVTELDLGCRRQGSFEQS